ncbi:hypothetical protein Bbelb_349950 [Branchiostoma belcheri]|nr:hypothetical protein Bbelb_349950 [Branchiostoma belcheri]
MGSSGSILTQHRSHIALSVLGDDVTKIPEILKGDLAISEEAERKYMGKVQSRHITGSEREHLKQTLQHKPPRLSSDRPTGHNHMVGINIQQTHLPTLNKPPLSQRHSPRGLGFQEA